MMKKQLLLFVLMMLPLVASAHDISVQNADGVRIYYNYTNDGKELAVTFRGPYYDYIPNEYKGNVVIPEDVIYEDKTYKVTSIGESAFSGCYGLTSVTIPNSVTSIGQSAFHYCSGLSSITIPNSVTSIGNNAFYVCHGLSSITIPNSVTSIGNSAFYGCSGLTSVTIGNNVTSIGESAFYNCIGLTSITIPNSVTSIGQSAFGICYGLTSINIPNSLTSIENGTFGGCIGLTSITIPNNVTSIGDGAFSGCSSLTSITIPNSVTRIGQSAFNGCSGLTSVTIGNGIQIIQSFAFETCPNIADVTCYAESVPSTYSNAFNGSNIEIATLHVPSASIDAYKAADPWKNFKSIVAIETKINVANNSANAVLIQSEGGTIKVQGVDDRTNVSIYTMDGKQVGSTISQNNIAIIATSIQPGSIAIVKIGDKALKVVMK